MRYNVYCVLEALRSIEGVVYNPGKHITHSGCLKA